MDAQLTSSATIPASSSEPVTNRSSRPGTDSSKVKNILCSCLSLYCRVNANSMEMNDITRHWKIPLGDPPTLLVLVFHYWLMRGYCTRRGPFVQNGVHNEQGGLPHSYRKPYSKILTCSYRDRADGFFLGPNWRAYGRSSAEKVAGVDIAMGPNGAEQVGAWNPHAPLGNLKRIDDTKWLHTTAVRVNKNAAQEQLRFERVPRVNGHFSQY